MINLQQKKQELEQLLKQHNLLQQQLQQLGQVILKKQGGIEVLEELKKEDKEADDAELEEIKPKKEK